MAQEQLKLIISAHNFVLSAGTAQKAWSGGDMARHRGFNESLLLPSAESGDSGRLARVRFASLET